MGSYNDIDTGIELDLDDDYGCISTAHADVWPEEYTDNLAVADILARRKCGQPVGDN